jgi:hypothetical protein
LLVHVIQIVAYVCSQTSLVIRLVGTLWHIHLPSGSSVRSRASESEDESCNVQEAGITPFVALLKNEGRLLLPIMQKVAPNLFAHQYFWFLKTFILYLVTREAVIPHFVSTVVVKYFALIG